MFKHLPGQHNQKLHGHSNSENEFVRLRRVLSKAVRPYGSAYVSKSPNGVPSVRVSVGHSFNAHVYPVATAGQVGVEIEPLQVYKEVTPFSNYSAEERNDFHKGLAAVESGIKRSGYSAVQIHSDELPVTLANRLGYTLRVYEHNGIATNLWIFINAVDNEFNRQYGFRKITNTEKHSLASHLIDQLSSESGLLPKHFMEIPHPDYPEVPFFLEYLLTRGHDSNLMTTLRYHKSL